MKTLHIIAACALVAGMAAWAKKDKACPICKNSGRKFICISVLELRNSRKSNKVLFGE